MKWIRIFFLPLTVVLISIILSIISIELVLRIVKKDSDWDVVRKANILRNFEFNYNLDSLYKSKSKQVNYIRNKYGLRDDCLSPGEIKILTVGGSTTDQRYISFSSTYQKILQDRIEKDIGNFGCVSNAGVDGHSTWGHLFSFDKWFPLIEDFSPDYVLLYVGVNDVNFERLDKSNLGFDFNTTNNFKGWLKQLEIVNYLLPVYRYYILQSDDMRPAYSRHNFKPYNSNDYIVSSLNELTKSLSNQNAFAFRKRFEKLLEKISDIDAVPICVSQPHRYIREINGIVYGIKDVLGPGFSGIDYDYSIREINSIMSDLCGRLFLDLYNYEFSNDHFYDGIHTTEIGSILVGNLISDFIINNKLHLSLKGN